MRNCSIITLSKSRSKLSMKKKKMINILLDSCIFLVIIGYTSTIPTCFGFVIVNHNKHKKLSLLSLSSIKTTESSTTTLETTIIDNNKSTSNDEQKIQNEKIPIHLLAGFLGSGKTTTLKHILENTDGLRVGVIVNDVASVNIDAKLILSSSSSSNSSSSSSSSSSNASNDKEGITTASSCNSIVNDDIVELQNGCACCSLAGELFDSIESLLLRTTSTSKRSSTSDSDSDSDNENNNNNSNNNMLYDAIIVELSGVADPIAIQNNWRDVINDNKNGTLVTDSTEIGNIITVVDATTFSSDYMTFDILKDRKEWYANNNNNNDEKQKQLPHSVNRQVVELLAEQIEAASIVIVNKQDLATTKEVQITMELTKSLNKDANIIATSNGKIPFIRNILLSPSSQDEETFSLNDNDDDDDSTSSSPSSHSHSHHDHNDTTTSDDDDDDDHDDDDEDADCTDSSHSHSHDDHGTTACDDADCTDPSHSHSHVHDDHVTATCDDTDCTDLSHSHSHEQDHSSATTCNESDCTDPSHSHSHGDYEPISCDDADCADPSHSHSHTHDHSTSMTSTTNLGISNFVYKASKPFNANRLMKLIWSWPIPIKDELDFITLFSSNNKPSSSSSSSKADKEDTSLAKIGYGVDNDNDADDPNSPFIGVLRSKGFCWIAPTAWEGLLADGWRHDKAMYWSHAGKHMGIQMGGQFWASVPESTMKDFFINKPNEYERILNEDFITKEFGDRRQEIVFIGIDLHENEIITALNDCLLTDDEMDEYRTELKKMITTTIQK